MIELRNDYGYIAHPKILNRLNELSNEINLGYGLDKHCQHAKELISALIGKNNASIHFLTGGTITNKIVIGHFLKPYEAVISVDTGHINVHETGAIEQTGHKVLIIQNKDGKVTLDGIKLILKTHCDEHMVKPKMVYISNSTEYGSIYKLEELKQISKICHDNNLYLYLDGARIGSALMSKENDISLKDIANLCDAFYIGGTKNGALLGEALVIMNKELENEFRYTLKNLGGMYAKSFVTGIQFEVLFEDNLFFEIAKKENLLADQLRSELNKINIRLYGNSSTNQVFAFFDEEQTKRIQEKINCEVFTRIDNLCVVRFVTHYLNSEEDINLAIEYIKEIVK